MPRILITFLVFISALQVSPSFGQDINAFGIPALTSAISANGETTYSLSLQNLTVDDCANRTPLACFGNDSFHSDNNCPFNIKTSVGNTTDATKSSTYCNCFILKFLHHEPYF